MALGSWWRSLLRRNAWMPGQIRAELEADPKPYQGRRSLRDWFVDVVSVPLCLMLFFVTANNRPDFTGARLYLDVGVGLITLIMLFWRRQYPVSIAIITSVLSFVAIGATGPAAIATFTVAVHRPLRIAIAIGALGIASAIPQYFIWPHQEYASGGSESGFTFFVTAAVFIAFIVGWGAVVRSRRQLLLTLADRARTAESEQRERIAAARATERERLAREMHDVLAHRMSLLSVHAGALEFRPNASPEEISRAAGVIRHAVHQMLVDLREVISMLRTDNEDLVSPERSLSALPTLLSEAQSADTAIDFDITLDRPVAEVPGTTSRAAYRVVQEGLTNARKHAPGQRVHLRINGGPGNDLTVELWQSLTSERSGDSIPGFGIGLVGLNERVSLAGGSLRHGPHQDIYLLSATLPWESGKRGDQ